jgi:endonuclease YncB( thermonuclease family)
MKRLLPLMTRVKLVSDNTQANADRYGRLLRYVSRVKDGRDVNRTQVWTGHAAVYVYNNVPFKRAAQYTSSEAAAKSAPRGIWKAC